MKQILPFLFALILSVSASGQNQNQVESNFSENSKIIFDFSSIEMIYFHSEEILADVNAFWETDSAYILAKEWHKSSGVPVRMEEWMENIQKISKKIKKNSTKISTFDVIDELKASEKDFKNKAITHLASFLPTTTTEISTKIFLTAYTLPWAFAAKEHSVISITDIHYDDDSEYILNLIVHELFHIGYSKNIKYRKEQKLKDKTKHSLIAQLHNEGMATYVAYKFQNAYSANGKEMDFKMLENMKIVKKKINIVNSVFVKAKNEDKDVLSVSWEKGIMKRAYYVVGAYMAKEIDEKLGREKLIETIEYGPRSFVSTYNSVVNDEFKIYEFVEN